MPPAKKDPPTAAESARAQQDAASDGIDYYELPKALVQRIAKSSIPENSKLQKETVTALQKSSTVFINYLAATAHDIATSRQHKCVSARDVLAALEVIQFGDMVEPLRQELHIFRKNANNYKKSTSANKSSASATGTGTGDSVSTHSKSSNLKGKGKAEAAHGPSPLSVSVSAADVATGADPRMGNANDDAGGEHEDESGEEEEGEGEGAEEEEEEDELADDIDGDEDVEDEGGEQEELVDRMAVDEEGIRQDIKAADLGPPIETK